MNDESLPKEAPETTATKPDIETTANRRHDDVTTLRHGPDILHEASAWLRQRVAERVHYIRRCGLLHLVGGALHLVGGALRRVRHT